MGEKNDWEHNYDYKSLCESVKERPGMYFGSVGLSGVHYAILSFIDFLFENNKKEIFVTLNGPDISITFDGEQPITNIWTDAVKAASEVFDDKGNHYKFRLSNSIFHMNKPNNDALFDSLREFAFLNKDMTITLNEHTFHYENGLIDLYQYLQVKSGLYWHSKHAPMSFQAKEGNLEIDVAFAAVSSTFDPCIRSYVNNRRTEENGVHVDGFMKGLKSILNKYRQYSCEHVHTLRNIDIGLIIHVKALNPEYEGATKRKLINQEIYDFASRITAENINLIFNENPEMAKDFVRCWRCTK